ncbi:MAG TPA: ABC transporter permease [Rectinema sp.]|jgi:peptide/nickel transport system permease protein|nr:ABC transporter permease [Spirochaetia bacterium]MDI9427162.1 ABC transporter permease [Spirochaetota bacterium]NLH89551.1 ABC transporter permease [Treponema sp.]OQC74268.1 MAG: Glutathione transport system permease protein GsiD [Spirochaetes bacterium ADurb.Bin001]HNP93632.1 ABC transporter permease [Rectinema sp.]
MSNQSFLRFLKRQSKNISQFWRQFSRNKLAVASLILVLIFALVAIFADILYSYDFVTSNSLENALLKPGETSTVYFQEKDIEHTFILGSDNYGRDILGRLVHGARISMIIGFVTVAMAVVIGGILGAIAGYKGGLFDTLIMRLTDIILSIPTILMSIAIVAALGNSFFNLLIAISTSLIPGYIRIVRASIISIKDQEYVEAARVIGAGDFRIVLRHILPNITSPIIVQSTLNVGSSILSASWLSFLGLGILPPKPEWGNMLSEAREFIQYAPHLLFAPGIAILLTVLAYNIIGDGLRDALDPKLRR